MSGDQDRKALVALRRAGRKVLQELNARQDQASTRAVPVYRGQAELAAALRQADRALARRPE